VKALINIAEVELVDAFFFWTRNNPEISNAEDGSVLFFENSDCSSKF
jgi:hypothetical protein